MRRAAGIAGGSVFGATQEVPVDLAATLAHILAQLHALPEMDELHDVTDSINHELWRSRLGDCVHRYLERWSDTFAREPHLPSPGIAALFRWVLENMPDFPSGRPVLLHGDIGFHNFLFDDGRLTAVLDWEHAHLGDPAEDLAYVRNTLGSALDWPRFLQAYRDFGGAEVSACRVHFFQIWGHLRNAAAAHLATGSFANGTTHEPKLALLPHHYVPVFLRTASALIDHGPETSTP
jgi:aminoglycoside phosphotransferase (APT) family kinase protein